MTSANEPQDTFVFCGYLMQDPFLKDFKGREQFLLATIDTSLRCTCEDFRSPTFDEFQGHTNATLFRTIAPDPVEHSGYVLSGYAIDRAWLTAVAHRPAYCEEARTPWCLYRYAAYARRTRDGLQRLGYDVADGCFEHLSILHNCNVSLEKILSLGGTLNRFGLFDDCGSARRFAEAIHRSDIDEPHYQMPVVWEVFGSSGDDEVA